MTFQETLVAAIADLSQFGFDSVERVDRWVERLRAAARVQAGAGRAAETLVEDGLAAIYRRLVEKGGVSRFNPGVQAFTLERVKPKLRAELDRRIMASAQLIRNNRTDAIDTTLRRFQGWATSIPVGGSDADDKRVLKKDFGKPLRQLAYRERVVAIDQGHKLTASVSEILARDTNAIACEWKSNWRQANYDYRKDHKERDGKIYMLRGNWAQEKGLVKVGPAGYYEDITSVGSEPMCRCSARWVYNLRSLPPEMLTEKGKTTLAEARQKATQFALQAPGVR